MNSYVISKNSGGRTSAYMTRLLQEKYGRSYVISVFNDTGAEHPLTYEFIDDCDTHFGFNTIRLRAVVHHGEVKGNTYLEIPSEISKWDLSAMKEILKKYGGFTINRPHCTSKLKTDITTKFLVDKNLSEYTSWLGIRIDEPPRLVGKSSYSKLKKTGMTADEIADHFIATRQGDYSGLTEDQSEIYKARDDQLRKLNIRYLAEISDFDKQDVLNWWSNQSFDLQIPEHLGNCVFCIKKSDVKIALAQRHEPELFKEWVEMHMSDDVRLMKADAKGIGHIYRNWETPEMLIARFSGYTTSELIERVYKTGSVDTGSCSESCEVHSELWD